MACVTAHALLSALLHRLATGGVDASAAELRAIVGAGCPRSDVEAALDRATNEGALRARALLATTETPERRAASR